MVDYDSPWKDTLECFFPEFMRYFFPRAYRAIDWSRGHSFLDKELQRLLRNSSLGRRHVDKLVQVRRRDGAEDWLLIHVEIQAQREPTFAERLFIYHYRLFDRHHRPVVTLVILADESPDFRPRQYHHGFLGCDLRFRFPMVKLLDLAGRPSSLARSRNPFALVVMAHLAAQNTARDPARRLETKLGLLRRLYALGWKREKILALLRFIDWVLTLPEELDNRFWALAKQLEEGPVAKYVTSLERLAIRQGLEKGMQQGMQQGMEKGRLEGQHELLRKQLQHRFGPLPDWVLHRLAGADTAALVAWGERLLDVDSLEAVFQ